MKITMQQRTFIYLLLSLIFYTKTFSQVKRSEKKTVQTSSDPSFKTEMYSSKPKNAWEFGLHGGHYFIDGDVDTKLPGGYGFGLHLRKAIHYAFSIRAELFYGKAKGLDPQPWAHHNIDGNRINETGGGLLEPTFEKYNPLSGLSDGYWFPNYKTTQIYGAVQGIINIGNLLFHKEHNMWNWYLGIGAGLSSRGTKLDLLNDEKLPYTSLLSKSGFTEDKFNTKKGRTEIKNALEKVYDGIYESEGFKKAGIFRLGDETNIFVVFTSSIGISRKISKRFNIGIEHQLMATDDDYLDGIRFRTEDDLTADVDMQHYTSIRFGINLGNFNKITEPLYWLNPLNQRMNDLAALKARPEFEITDSDGDGVIDMLDQELKSLTGCRVDTKGVNVDSDGDGIIDCKDKEPYSQRGSRINEEGVAVVNKCDSCLSEKDVINLIERNTKTSTPIVKDNCGKWFLPLVHFDLNSSMIKPAFYGHLHHIATLMEMCPKICLTATGFFDNSSENATKAYERVENVINYVVSKYKIDRNRFKLLYSDQAQNVFGQKQIEKINYLQRSVEFRFCYDTDFEKAKPDSNSKKGKGIKYFGERVVGNKNSGY